MGNSLLGVNQPPEKHDDFRVQMQLKQHLLHPFCNYYCSTYKPIFTQNPRTKENICEKSAPKFLQKAWSKKNSWKIVYYTGKLQLSAGNPIYTIYKISI